MPDASFSSRLFSSTCLSFFLLLAFCIYSTSFSKFPIIETGRQSVLGEADVSSFQILIRDFDLGKNYGDPYRLEGRTNHDIAQKHKIHHILYVILAALIYKGFVLLYGLIGISTDQALYSVNALLGCINVFLLFLLLKRVDGGKAHKGVFILLYTFCLSSWIFYSVPDSWGLSATLLLLFLVLHYTLKRPINPYAIAGFVGFAMLNNVFLGTLCFFLMTRFWVETDSISGFLGRCLAVIVIAIATWLAGMTLLSVFDPGFRPDHYFHYTLWFKEHIAPPIRLFDDYYWKAAFTQLYITSILSNQSVPNVPQESLLYTIQQSCLGLVATLIYMALVAVIGWNGIRYAAARLKENGGLDKLLATIHFPAALYALAWLFLTVIMDTSGAFLYSTMVTPMLVIVLYRFTDWQRRSHKLLWAAAIGALLINNSHQIMGFRETLAAMTP